MTKQTADGRLLQEVAIVEMEAGDINIGNIDIASVSGMTYLGEQTIAMNGSSLPVTLPEGTNFVEISAEAGAVRYTYNGDATANSGGYIPEDQTRYILKVDNMTSLELYGESPAIAHLIYKQEQ